MNAPFNHDQAQIASLSHLHRTREQRNAALWAQEYRRGAVKNISSACRYIQLGMSAHLINEAIRRARHDWRLAKEYEEKANGLAAL